MSQVKSFTVNGKTYNAAMAPAVKQDELLGMITAPLMERALGAAQIGKVLGDDIVAPMFMSMRAEVKQKIVEIIMGQVFVAGTSIPVTVDDFSGRMVEYNQLLAKLLMWNLGDFSSWLQNVLVDAAQPQAPVDAPQ